MSTPKFKLNLAGILSPARQVASPNYNDRPANTEITAIIIHAISLPPGEFGGDCIERFFTNQLDHDAHPYFAGLRDLRVSAHFLIRRDGEAVQFVSTCKRAWHAGESMLHGRPRVNDFSIGIELEGCDDAAFADAQYAVLTGVVRCLMTAYPGITRDCVVGHSDVAPGRKTDPGPGFEWGRLGF